jgi:hypothetical protein
LRRYGFTDAADRISIEFLSMVLQDFLEHGVIKEKYNAETRRSDLAAGIKFGYSSNEAGFGWTNAAFLVLYGELSPRAKQEFEQRCTSTQHAQNSYTVALCGLSLPSQSLSLLP